MITQTAYDDLRREYDELWRENERRGEIIARHVLGWERYLLRNKEQWAYAPSAGAADKILIGERISKFVDEAIKKL